MTPYEKQTVIQEYKRQRERYVDAFIKQHQYSGKYMKVMEEMLEMQNEFLKVKEQAIIQKTLYEIDRN